ncbi:Predicted membrane protein [Legionella beliardensis]|uniref:Predicted membrane protein n=1 Tax=Legionella beliardensis TaxID=91822 RepID=A0A378I4B4_9GAMM|nr:DUF2243 domain-containing protein [Legionella beliardensis]STX29843.1 Predicted membrane protein [Legionella beliardensis]
MTSLVQGRQTLLAAGLLLGIGLGGFFDGIVFHQILQAHNMLSNIIIPNTVANIEINMFWDGVFHAFTWIMTIIGLWLLWKSFQEKNLQSGTYFFGAILVGFGCFNIVEGIIDHLILQLHHVIQRTSAANQLYSDMAFLISGIILVAIGIWLMKKQPMIYKQ